MELPETLSRLPTALEYLLSQIFCSYTLDKDFLFQLYVSQNMDQLY